MPPVDVKFELFGIDCSEDGSAKVYMGVAVSSSSDFQAGDCDILREFAEIRRTILGLIRQLADFRDEVVYCAVSRKVEHQ